VTTILLYYYEYGGDDKCEKHRNKYSRVFPTTNGVMIKISSNRILKGKESLNKSQNKNYELLKIKMVISIDHYLNITVAYH